MLNHLKKKKCLLGRNIFKAYGMWFGFYEGMKRANEWKTMGNVNEGGAMMCAGEMLESGESDGYKDDISTNCFGIATCTCRWCCVSVSFYLLLIGFWEAVDRGDVLSLFLQLDFYYSLLVLTRKLPSLLSAGAAAAAAPFIGAGASNWQQFPALGGSGSAVERKRRQKWHLQRRQWHRQKEQRVSLENDTWSTGRQLSPGVVADSFWFDYILWMNDINANLFERGRWLQPRNCGPTLPTRPGRRCRRRQRPLHVAGCTKIAASWGGHWPRDEQTCTKDRQLLWPGPAAANNCRPFRPCCSMKWPSNCHHRNIGSRLVTRSFNPNHPKLSGSL